MRHTVWMGISTKVFHQYPSYNQVHNGIDMYVIILWYKMMQQQFISLLGKVLMN